MKRFSWLAFSPALVLLGFVGLIAVFCAEMSSFRAAVLETASHDLKTRTESAASTLGEPLQTGDFARVHEFGQRCAADGIRLCVRSGGSVVFDSLKKGASEPDAIYETVLLGGMEITLGMPLDRVLAPFRRARYAIALAALAGVIGTMLIFFVLYRQKVRIDELKKLEKFRKEFIADLSHEIKTPLTGILGSVDLLEPKDEMQTKLVDMISREAKRLNELVRQILALSRLERDEPTMNVSNVDIGLVLRDVAESFASLAERDGIELMTARTLERIETRCDRDLVFQAISNLVANAVRHSGAKAVYMAAHRMKDGVMVLVEDHGIGIPEAEMERVFERFYRLDASRSSDTGGSGLGLAIVRTIARLHGGDVTLKPAKPSGCRFMMKIGKM